MEPRIDIITLAVGDLERALDFYRDGLGLESRGVIATEFVGDDVEPAGAIAMFKLRGGLILSIYPRTELAKDAKVPLGPPKTGEFSLGHAVASKAEVDAVLTQAQAAGATLTDRAHDRPWGITPATFAIRTDTYGRCSGTHRPSARRSNRGESSRTAAGSREPAAWTGCWSSRSGQEQPDAALSQPLKDAGPNRPHATKAAMAR